MPASAGASRFAISRYDANARKARRHIFRRRRFPHRDHRPSIANRYPNARWTTTIAERLAPPRRGVQVANDTSRAADPPSASTLSRASVARVLRHGPRDRRLCAVLLQPLRPFPRQFPIDRQKRGDGDFRWRGAAVPRAHVLGLPRSRLLHRLQGLCRWAVDAHSSQRRGCGGVCRLRSQPDRRPPCCSRKPPSARPRRAG